MTKTRILYVSHNHPAVRPGGAEAYAYELFRSMRESEEFEPVFLAKGGPPVGLGGRPHTGTYFAPVGSEPDEYFFYTDNYEFDWFLGTIRSKQFYTKHFRDFLKAFQPDVVHFQHTLFLGYEMIREVRNTLPNAAVVYTLHEFLPICHRNGQMVRTINDDELCTESSPRRCHECFPQFSQADFFMRKKFIESQFAGVDLFLAPSQQLLERYVSWGIPRSRIRFEEYGRIQPERRAAPSRASRNRFAFFGQLTPFKGVHVLLEAMEILARAKQRSQGNDVLSQLLGDSLGEASTPAKADDPHLWVHGANLELQEADYRERFSRLLDSTRDNVTFVGKYSAADIPSLMENIDWVVVPSIWWENSPLVIQEAFMHNRPVICSDIGGMAEKVADGVNGLHFRVNDARSLADTIERASGDGELWSALQDAIPPPYTMERHVKELSAIYGELMTSSEELVRNA
jgi:glycosyltransferase involved in cell wall biosynthesis